MLFFKAKQRGTNIPKALTFLNHVLHRRSIIFLLTDFLHSFGVMGQASSLSGNADFQPVAGKIPALHHRQDARSTWSGGRDAIQEIGLTNVRHDLVCVHLHDPRESALPPAGLLTIEDAETGELLEMDSARAVVRRQFASTNAERLAELDRSLCQAGVATLRLSTAEPFAQTLQRFFELRRGRRRG
jgi:hypothetical protein